MTDGQSQPGLRRVSSRALLTGMAAAGQIAVLLFATGAQAQDATVLSPIAVTATEVAPGGVEIDAEQIEHANPVSIKDVFDTEAAVNIGGGSDVSRKSYVNGIEDTNLNVKIDGARQINSAFHHLGTVVVDPALLKTVQIETGVGPADVGPGALGGSIAYDTKSARDILEVDETYAGWLKLQYDTNPANKRAVATQAVQYEGFEGLLNLSYENGGSYEDGRDREVEGTSQKMKSALGKFGWNGLDGERVELTGTWLRDRGVRPNRANFGALTNGAPATEQTYKRSSVSLSFKDETPTENFNPELVLSVNQSYLFIDELAFGPFRFDLESRTTSYSGKVGNTFSNDLDFLDSGAFTVGADFYRDIGTGNLSGGFAPAGVPLQNEETSDDVGVFIQARMNLTEALRLSTGARYDNQWFEGVDGTDIHEHGPSVNGNVEYDLIPGLTTYAGAASVFGPVPLGESAIYNFAGQWEYDNLSNSRSTNYKVGTTLQFGAFSADANVYKNKITGSHDRGNRLRNSTRDIDARGLNVSAQYDFLDGFIRGTYAHNKIRSDGEVLVSGSASFHGLQMGDTFTLDGAFDVADTGFTIGGSSRAALRDTDNGTAERSGYVVFGTYVEWVPPSLDALKLRLDVKNIFDQTYVDRASAAQSDVANARAFPEPGRTFLLTAQMDF